MVHNGRSLNFKGLLDSIAPCGATLSSKIHGFFLYVTHLLIFSKREDDNGLNRQLGKPRIVYDPFFLGGGGEEARGRSGVQRGVTVKDI